MAFIPDEAVRSMRQIPPPAYQLYSYYCMKRDHQIGGYECPNSLVAEETGIERCQVNRLRKLLSDKKWINIKGDFIAPIKGDFSEMDARIKHRKSRDSQSQEVRLTVSGSETHSLSEGNKSDKSRDSQSHPLRLTVSLPETHSLTPPHPPIRKPAHDQPKEQESLRDMSTSPTIRAIFDFWRNTLNHPGAQLTPKRENKIKARLKQGYTPDQLHSAILGCRASPFHQGENKDGKIFDDLELICRDGEHVENFIAIYERSQKGEIKKPKLSPAELNAGGRGILVQ